MSFTAYSLWLIHRNLDNAITIEMRTPLPNNLKLRHLKKLRLAVKDRLAAQTLKKTARGAVKRIAPDVSGVGR